MVWQQIFAVIYLTLTVILSIGRIKNDKDWRTEPNMMIFYTFIILSLHALFIFSLTSRGFFS